MVPMRDRPHNLIRTLLLSLLSVGLLCVTACIEADIDSDTVEGTRSLQEALLAEEIEALLPGTWMSDTGSPDLGDLSIVFLGHDAMSGDVALLIEGETDESLEPALVSLRDNTAILTLNDGDWEIDSLGNEELVLTHPETGVTVQFHRMP
jgi:hypothetical protein